MRVLMAVAAVALLCASAAIVGTFTWTAGVGVSAKGMAGVWGGVFAAGAVAILVIESTCCAAAALAWRKRRYGGAALYGLVLRVAGGGLFTFDRGLMSTAFEESGVADVRAVILERRIGGDARAWSDVLTMATAAAFGLCRLAAVYFLANAWEDVAHKGEDVAHATADQVESSRVEPVAAKSEAELDPVRAALVEKAKRGPARISQRKFAEEHGTGLRVVRDAIGDLSSRGVIGAETGRTGTTIWAN